MSFLMVLQREHLEHREQGWFLRGSPGPACDKCRRERSHKPVVSSGESQVSGFSPILLNVCPAGGRVAVSGGKLAWPPA